MGTPNLDLKNDYADSDVTTRATYNSPVDYLDRAAEWFERFAGHGVESGWELQSDKTVSAGSGFVNHFWHQTAAQQTVTGWTNGVANYVNAHPSLSVDPASGNVTFGVGFIATTSSGVPAGAVPLASCTLDSSGNIVSGSISHARKRHAYNYQWLVLTLSINRTGIAAGETVTETIPLGATLYGGYTVELPAVPGFSVRTHSYEPTQFQIDVTNETAYSADYAGTATVRGIAGL
ncbi:MAG: hypothetical protein PVH68_10065 [Armatimonadota bacterium]|jgi:hypothetical protein